MGNSMTIRSRIDKVEQRLSSLPSDGARLRGELDALPPHQQSYWLAYRTDQELIALVRALQREFEEEWPRETWHSLCDEDRELLEAVGFKL